MALPTGMIEGSNRFLKSRSTPVREADLSAVSAASPGQAMTHCSSAALSSSLYGVLLFSSSMPCAVSLALGAASRLNGFLGLMARTI